MPNTTQPPFIPPLHELQHQVVRDLAWCCFSAQLMQELPESDAINLPIDRDKLWPWLMDIDQQPDALNEEIASLKSTRLGIYYEALWRFYFSHHPDWELIQHNLQVQRDGITLGAFDFLCRRGDEYWHIETAVKFYLCDARNENEAKEWHHWIGPNSEDRLDLKLSRLRQHQLPLHKTPEARAQLHALYTDVKEWKTGLCVQGYLFSPIATQYRPAFSNKNHESGYWWHLQNFLHFLDETKDTQWIIVERQYWLSPTQTKNACELFSSENLIHHLQKHVGQMKRPLLLATQKKAESNNQLWQEVWRGFVVPDNWPDKPEKT